MPEEQVSQTSEPKSKSWLSSNKVRLIAVGVVFAIAIGYLAFSAFPGNALYYLTIDELEARTVSGQVGEEQRVRVVGSLVDGSFQRRPGSTLATFDLQDRGRVLRAQYDGPVPDTFFNPRSQVVLEGNYKSGNVFHADNVIVKCPTKYESLRIQQLPEKSG